MRAAKAAARTQLGHIEGVQGFGMGENSVRVYVRNAAVSHQLPDAVEGVPVDAVVTGEITAQSSAKIDANAPASFPGEISILPAAI